LCRASVSHEHPGVQPWEPQDDSTTIIGALFDINAKLDEIGTHIVAIRTLLEDDDEEKEEED
jgi:hypothetical protein